MRMARLWGLLVPLAVFAQNRPVIVFLGPPGSGKSTQATMLSADRGIPVISSDDLIRRNASKFQQPGITGVEPHLNPAMNMLVEQVMSTLDLSRGVILDGYPASKTQGDYLRNLLTEFKLPPPVVIWLQVPDEVVRERLRQEDPQHVEQRLKDFHREFDFVTLYFEKVQIHEIDGTKKPEDVAKEVAKALAP
jgi:adenylate kinase